MKVRYDFKNKQFMMVGENEFEEAWLLDFCAVYLDMGTSTKSFEAEGRWFQTQADRNNKEESGILFRKRGWEKEDSD